MSTNLEATSHEHTMQRLELIKRIGPNGQDYWLAREIAPVLGYDYWSNFDLVVKRAAISIRSNGKNPDRHIRKIKTRISGEKDRNFFGKDYQLSRGACYLIAMNGDSSKPQIAGAQLYFTVQTRRMEEQDAKTEALPEDAKRLLLRGKVSASFKTVSRVASEVGVPSGRQGLFHEQRYKGLYGAARASVYQKKGLSPKEDILDRIGSLELSAHEFQMNLASSALKNENVLGEEAALKKNLEIAQDVRRTIEDSGATLPEDLPLEEHISSVRKRLTGKKRNGPVSPPSDPSASSQLSLLSQPSVPGSAS